MPLKMPDIALLLCMLTVQKEVSTTLLAAVRIRYWCPVMIDMQITDHKRY